MSTTPKAGDQYVLDLCTSTTGELIRDAVVEVRDVQRLGCKCYRLTTRRPGDYAGPLAGPLHLHVQRCAFHRRNNPDGLNGAPEPQRHVVETAGL